MIAKFILHLAVSAAFACILWGLSYVHAPIGAAFACLFAYIAWVFFFVHVIAFEEMK